MIISSTVEETEKIGERIGEKLKGNEVIALWGGMGMGKTALTRGVAEALGAKEQVCSPTFAIVNEYKGKSYLDLRIYYTTDDGINWLPTKKGVTVSPDNLELLKDAVDEAMKELMTVEE